jgi:hypothetical protein
MKVSNLLSVAFVLLLAVSVYADQPYEGCKGSFNNLTLIDQDLTLEG